MFVYSLNELEPYSSLFTASAIKSHKNKRIISGTFSSLNHLLFFSVEHLSRKSKLVVKLFKFY